MRPALGLLAPFALILGVATAPATAAPRSAAGLRVGSLTLKPCADGPHGWWCGSLQRALDPRKPAGRKIPVALRWRPATSGKPDGPPLVAVEGGPGYPSIGSRVEYTGIYGPLLKRRSLLLVDNRGTGGSALIDCPMVQTFTGVTSSDAFPARAARCAQQIDRRFGAGADSLFATAYAADDLDAVMGALKLAPADLYGDSYGTYFAQSFMARHPGRLHSVVLDSSYAARDLDPWYGSSGTAARAALDLVCARDAACAAAGPGSASARLAQLLDVLRRSPITGSTRDADGSTVKATVDVRAVVDLVQDAGSDPVIYRELDASVRAALGGDDVPLLRLAAQAHTWSHSPSPADYFSNGLYLAVACADYPQLFSTSASPADRRTQFASRLPSAPAADFAPFTVSEWLTVSAYTQPYRACLNWPSPRTPVPPPVPAGAAPLPAGVPVLILGGDLDSLTPLSDAPALAPALGATTRIVTLRNTVHVTTEGDTYLVAGMDCGRKVIREFVRSPAKLASLDARCGATIPAVHTPGAYPRSFAAVTPATASGADPGERARRAAVVAAGAMADAVIRNIYGGVGKGPGLRGGSFTVKGDRFTLRGVRYTSDSTVDGTGTYRGSDGAVRAQLSVNAPGGGPVRVALTWAQRSTLGTGRVGSQRVTFPAP